MNDQCKTCLKCVADSENGVVCGICEKKYHAKCQDITDAVSKTVLKHESLHWFCKSCSFGSGNVILLIRKLQNKIDLVEDELLRIKNECNNANSKTVSLVRDEVKRLESVIEISNKEVNDQVNAKLESQNNENSDADANGPLWSEIVGKAVDDHLGSVEADVMKVHEDVKKAKIAFEEQKDRESRDNNIVIYNCLEKRTESRDDWHDGEMESCMKLFNDVLELDIEKDSIKKVFRLGKRNDNKKGQCWFNLQVRPSKTGLWSHFTNWGVHRILFLAMLFVI